MPVLPVLVYLEASGPVVLSITTSGTEVSRYWKIRITQISCPSNLKGNEIDSSEIHKLTRTNITYFGFRIVYRL